MNLIDTHCHIDVAEFDADRNEVLTRCREAHVNDIIVPAIMAASWPPLLNLCNANAMLHPALGMHPVYIDIHKEPDLTLLESMLADYRPVAIGEIGLDYYVKSLNRERQVYFFESQLEIARAAGLPVILHVRKSHDHVLQLLKKHKVKGGTCHAFNGSLQQAEVYLDLGFKLGFGGMLTYERSTKLRKLASQLPDDAIVLETDAPDMTVASHHGERNSPEYLPECLQSLAEIRNQDMYQVANQTTANAHSVFSFPY